MMSFGNSRVVPLRQVLLSGALALSAVLLVACGASEDETGGSDVVESKPRMASIKGTLTYMETIPLAPESMIKVELLDVSKADAPAEVVAETVFLMPGKPPLPFVLEYDANKIEPGHRYSLRANVMEQTRLMFVSDRTYPVLEGREQPPVDILLKHVPGGDIEKMAENVRAKNPLISGHYRYRNKEGVFVDCSDGVEHPLSREGAIFSVESEYRDVAESYGDEVFLSVAGKYVTRPARNGQGKEDYLVVLQVEEMDAEGICP